MARNPLVFENGTLVSNAKVTIDGTDYNVTPAEYQGTTPLSAENINELQTRIYDYIDNLSQVITLETSVTGSINAVTKIPIKSIRNQIGTQITANTSTNRIIIGDGVSHVMITAQAQGTITNNPAIIEIYKNGTQIKKAYMKVEGSYQTMPIVPFVESVSSGDYFELYLTAGTLNASAGLSNPTLCYMTVQKID